MTRNARTNQPAQNKKKADYPTELILMKMPIYDHIYLNPGEVSVLGYETVDDLAGTLVQTS